MLRLAALCIIGVLVFGLMGFVALRGTPGGIAFQVLFVLALIGAIAGLIVGSRQRGAKPKF